MNELFEQIATDFINGNRAKVRESLTRMSPLLAAHVAVEVLALLGTYWCAADLPQICRRMVDWEEFIRLSYESGGG